MELQLNAGVGVGQLAQQRCMSMERCIGSCFSLEASRFSQTGILPRGPLPQRAGLPGPYHEPPDEEASHRGEDKEHDDHNRGRCAGRGLVGGGRDSADEVAREGEALVAHAGRLHAALGHAPAVPAADLHGAVCAALDAPAADAEPLGGALVAAPAAARAAVGERAVAVPAAYESVGDAGRRVAEGPTKGPS